MRHSTKRGLLTVLAVLLCAMTALGIPALADAGTWTGLSPAEEPAEAYISLPGNSYSTFTQGFALAESQPVSITVAPNTATGSDARAELFFLNSGVAPTFINGSSAARGISVAFCGGSTATAFQPVAAGFGDGTWSTKPMYVSGAQPWIRVGEKAEIGLAKLDGEYWLTLNGEKVTTTVGEEQVNILSAIGGDFVSWIADGAEAFAATGRYNNSLSVYDLTGNGRLYTAQDLYDLPRTGSGSYTANNFYTDYLVFDSPLGVNIPLDASKEITVTLQAEPGWVNFAFLTECSNGGFAANNSRGTGFSLMTQDYGGLVLDIMNMNNGIQTPKVTSYFSSGAPADSHGQPNADGVTVGARDPFRFTIKPVEGGFEFWLQGKRMTAYGSAGLSFYDSVKDSIGNFVNEDGFTYLNVTKAGTAEEGRIYSIVNGDTVYTADQIAVAMTAAPKQLITSSARTATGEGSYSAGLPVLDFGFDFSVGALPEGGKTLTFSDGENEGQTLTLAYDADGHLTGAVGEGTAVAAGTANEPVSAGEYVQLRTLLSNGHLYLTLNGTRVGELDPLTIADENGQTFLSFGGTDTEAALSFYTLYEQAAHALKTKVTVPGVTGAAVELLDENEEVIDSVCFASGNTYTLYAAAGAAPVKIRVSAEGFTTAVVDFAAETSVVLETPTYTGTVSLTANGEAVTGAVITLIKGEETVVMTEGESGVYTAENLTGIWTVTVQKAGYTFPAGQLSGEAAVSLAATEWPYTGTVSLTANGIALTGASVTLTQGESTIAMTEGESGVYTAGNLSGTYAVTVEKEGLVFETGELSFAAQCAEMAAVTFEGKVTVSVGEELISGATVSAEGLELEVTDNGDGTYTLSAYAGSYTVTAVKEGYAFAAVTLSNAEAEGEIAGTYSAAVTLTVAGEPAEGATVTLTQGETVVTAVWFDGVYVAEGLIGSYTVTAEKEGFTFAEGGVTALERTVILNGVAVEPEEPEDPEDPTDPTDPTEPNSCSSGCNGGVFGGSAALSALVLGAAAVIRRKKRG